jgi:hypothetical protein
MFGSDVVSVVNSPPPILVTTAVTSLSTRKNKASEYVLNELFQHLKNNILKPLSFATPMVTVKTTFDIWATLGVNVSFLATDENTPNPYTGEQGYSDVPALTRRMSINMSDGKAGLSYWLGVGSYRINSPSCFCVAFSVVDNDNVKITRSLIRI